MARELVTVARFDIPAKAHIARNALEDAGIRSVLQDEQLVAMDYLLNLAVGGIKLQVWDEDAERALAILEGLTHVDGKTGGEGEGEFEPDDENNPDGPQSAESSVLPQSTENDRDRYAQRMIWATLCSILIAPISFYSAYLLLMTLFSEGKLTGSRQWGIWLAALVTPVVMCFSLVWFVVVINLITTGRVEP